MANHIELAMVNLLYFKLGLILERLHSAELNRLTKNIPIPTEKYPRTMQTQRSMVKGCMKEKTPGFFFSGFFIMMLMPTSMNGFEKSTTCSLSLVMESPAMAISASCKRGKLEFRLFFPLMLLKLSMPV